MRDFVKTFILACLILGNGVYLRAMPPNLLNDSEGFLEVSIGYTFSIPFTADGKIGHNISFDLSLISKELWGGGCMLRLGEEYLEFTANIQKRFDAADNTGVPVILKFGFINTPFEGPGLGLGLGLESGLNFYFNEKSEPENIPSDALEFAEFSYTYIQGLLGLSVVYNTEKGFLIVPTGTFNLGYASTPHAGGGTYHVY